ncbi:MAG TPA: hypothetical protein VMW75_22475 [Thermoanaerobaculia bacterium]|nr:hypothetical protein [Thermoanaerobaculia bacterium]
MLAISLAALGMTAAALLTSPAEQAAARPAAARAEAPRSAVARGHLAGRPTPSGTPAGERCSLRRSPTAATPGRPAGAPRTRCAAALSQGAREAPANASRRLPG